MDKQLIGALQQMLNSIEATVSGGAEALYPILLGYAALFTFLAICLTAWGILRGGRALGMGIELLVRLALIVLAIENWPFLLGGLRDIAISMGLFATGNRLQLADFLDPGMLVKRGLESGVVLWKAFVDNLAQGGYFSVQPFILSGAYLLAWLAYVGAFMVMAYKVFWWQVETLIAALAGMVLLPALIFRHTAFVAAGVLNYAANQFARFLIGALLAGALWQRLDSLTALAVPSGNSIDMRMQAAFWSVGVIWIWAMSFLAANRLASMLTSGVPGMAGGGSLGSFVSMMAMGARALLTGAGLGAAGGLGAARVGAGAVQGAIGAAQADVGGMLASGGGERHRLGEAARQLYAGARSGMQGGMQASLGRYMHAAGNVATRATERTISEVYGMRRRAAPDTRQGGGVRHH